MYSSFFRSLTAMAVVFVLLLVNGIGMAGVSPYVGKLILTEVSTKTSDDKLEIYVVDGSVDFTGFKVYKGTTLRFTFPADWHANGMKTGDYIVLSQDLTSNDVVKSDNNPGFWDGVLGGYLASTDDIVWISDVDGNFVDVIIWSDMNGNFTGSETKANDAASDGMWDNYDFSSGDAGAWTDTDDLHANQTIARFMNESHTGYVDNNSRTDWYLCSNPSFGSENDQSLPVFLTSFRADVQPNGILLHWTTASETNCLGFNLYRAEGELGEFRKIAGLIPGAGNSAEAHSYDYFDGNVVPGGTYRYRLEDVGSDGMRRMHSVLTVKYLPEERKKNAMPGTFALGEPYPNPFGPKVNREYSALYVAVGTNLENRSLAVEIVNVLGQRVKKVYVGQGDSGSQTLFWYGRDEQGRVVPPGIYFWRISLGGRSYTRRVVWLK